VVRWLAKPDNKVDVISRSDICFNSANLMIRYCCCLCSDDDVKNEEAVLKTPADKSREPAAVEILRLVKE
jgi:hypothetical protein